MVKSSSSSSSSAGSNGKRPYKGVRMRSWGSWVSEIRAPNQKSRIWLGSYSTPEAAARAYDAALICLKGSAAALNFPNSPPHHLPPTPMSSKSIQRIAAAAAKVTPITSFVSSSSTNVTNTASPTPSTTSSSNPSPNAIEDDAFSGISSLMEPIGIGSSVVDFGAFQSPKCMDEALNSWAIFDPIQLEDLDVDYERDIHLWSFC